MKLIRIEDNRQSLLKDVHELYCKTSNKKLEDVFLYLYANDDRFTLATFGECLGNQDFINYFFENIDKKNDKNLIKFIERHNLFLRFSTLIPYLSAGKSAFGTFLLNMDNNRAKKGEVQDLDIVIVLHKFFGLDFVENWNDTLFTTNDFIMLNKFVEKVRELYLKFLEPKEEISQSNIDGPKENFKTLNKKQMMKKNFISFYASQLAMEFNSQLKKLNKIDGGTTITPHQAINPVFMGAILNIEPMEGYLLKIVHTIKKEAMRLIYAKDASVVYNYIRQETMEMCNMNTMDDMLQDFSILNKNIDNALDENDEYEEESMDEVPYDVLEVLDLEYENYIMIMSAIGYFMTEDM